MKILILLFSINLILSGHSKEEWKDRVIYQVLTDRFARDDDETPVCENLLFYCGGNYKGLIKQLDYISGMGFNAIWISPIIKNYEGSYHGYHFTNLYELNEHFGTEEDFKVFIEECHKKDIWIMLDVVANHIGPVGHDFSNIVPFNKSEYYHDACDITDWTNQPQVENCRLSDLPDLKHENKFVTEKLLEWIKDIVNKYNIDGIRIDTIPEVPKWFWDKFGEASGVFQMGEAFNGNPYYVGGYQGHLTAVFNYPLYYTIFESFCGNMKNIEKYLLNTREIYKDPTVLGVFVDNHDNKRFLNACNDTNKLDNAVVFSLLWEGIPFFYYGDEQYFNGGDDPKNRETMWGHYDQNSNLYIIIQKTNLIRKQKELYKYDIIQRYSDEVFYAFTRGNSVLVALTRGESCQRTITYHDFKIGSQLCNVLKENDCITVNENGIEIIMDVEPKIYVLSE